MSDFIVSARKYRPATFDTVVGQQHITNTLKNAILNKQLAHAFLFCGPRGVGKTTCARILGKTINCFNLQPNGEACDTCDSCNSFNEGASFNIVELDAASNNSVDNIRELIENVRYAPQMGKYKVYIIDEVHMLSQSAFNAFLKTLEEPPAHAIFILATTDKHKILPTILSRCQIFDFNRIKVEDIANHLAFIANSENVTADKDALHIIAQKAEGGLRDACSMFDQIVAFSGNNITYQHVIENLNILDYDYYFSITDAMLQANVAQCLVIFDDILKRGFDGHLFTAGLASHFRNLLVTRDAATLQLLEVTNSVKIKYQEQCAKSSLQFLINGINLCSKTDFQYKVSKNQRLLVELTLMQIANTEANAAEKKNDISEITSQNQSKLANQVEPSALSERNFEKQTSNEQNAIAPTEEAVKPVEHKIIGTPKFTSSGGISALLKKKTNDDALNNTVTRNFDNDLANEFSLDSLQNAWLQFTQKYEKTSHFYITLTTNKPTNIGNNISFLIDNAAQHLQLNEISIELLGSLRKSLSNNNLKLDFVINKSDTKRLAYTNREKFDVMAKKNPALLYLKEKFEGEL